MKKIIYIILFTSINATAQQTVSTTLSSKRYVKAEDNNEKIFVNENFKKSSSNLENQISSKKEIYKTKEILKKDEVVIDKPNNKTIIQSNLKKIENY